MHRAKNTLITDLNQHLTCKLCKGYFVDATTIIECLHSFCKSCIVKYLETNKYCPVCDVQVHKTKPLLNIRPDKTLQDIVYKLVPRLFQNEIQRRRDFYMAHPEAKPTHEDTGETYQNIITSDESISLTMCYYGCKESARYLRCPAAVSIGHLQKLIRAKYGLFDNHHVDILYNQDCLNFSLTLMDVAYIYSWKRKAPIELSYRIYEYTAKKIKIEENKVEATVQTNNNNWKEVQLRISENGEMSITGIQDEALELVNNNNYKSEIVTVVENKVSKKELPELKFIGKSVSLSESNTSVTTSCVSLCSSTATKTVFSTINSSKCSVSSDSDTKTIEEDKKNESIPIKTSDEIVPSPSDKGVKRKLDLTLNEQPIKQQKQTILNHSIGLHNLSNNHPLKKHSQLNKVSDSIDKTESKDDGTFCKPNVISKNLTNVTLSRPGTPITAPKPISKPCYMPKPVINVPKPSTSIGGGKSDVKVQQTCSSITKTESKPIPTIAASNQSQTQQQQQPQPQQQNKLNIKSKASTPIGYKTLRDPPKSWNSQIAKANINKPITDPKYSDLKNVRPAKFFKMRNNLPRYLGNPASGVKPMYQVHVSPEKEKTQQEPKGEIKKHSIVKIDPKTLKPISEKAPETTSLSNSSGDLKINTSSVSIFNPLKLQNSSPKGERKSPKSPHSPKTKSSTAAAAATASPSNKRDKLNLNFTPSNPFIPNLTSPTVSPNQFLYPSGPPGFPPYDPRVMAAYHNLFYGQRMAFPPGLSLDLNQRKNFDLPGPTSPKLGGIPQPLSPQQTSLKLQNTEQLSMQSGTSRTISNSNNNNNHNSSSSSNNNNNIIINNNNNHNNNSSSSNNNSSSSSNNNNSSSSSSNNNNSNSSSNNTSTSTSSSVNVSNSNISSSSSCNTSSTSSNSSNNFNKTQSTPSKKSSKESTNKIEKSLQNAVEKLTQNRVKEIKNEAAGNINNNNNKNNNTTNATTNKPQVETKQEGKDNNKEKPNQNDNNKDNQEKNEEKKNDESDNRNEKKTSDNSNTTTNGKADDVETTLNSGDSTAVKNDNST